ncbi:MAG: trehalase family glycosidase [Bacteroidota bacterium]
MKKRRCLILLVSTSLQLLYTIALQAQPVQRIIKTTEYKEIQKKLCTGWNTWYNNSVASHVLLPEGFSINLCLTEPGRPDYLKQILKASDIQQRPEKVLLGLRADDGSYTSLALQYKEEEISIQTATDGNDELILVTPGKKLLNYLVVEAGLLWNREGLIGMRNNKLVGMFSSDTISIGSTEVPVPHAYAQTTAPFLAFSMKHEIGIYTGKTRTLSEIKTIIGHHREEQQKRMESFGDLSESFKAMQTILSWNTIYDAANNRVMTPVSRMWNVGWGGFVLFDWDTYFASYMLSLFNKNLAYANAIEITKAITPGGFIPNFQSPFGNSSWDRSQPRVGSKIILEIYKHYKEKWFLDEVYDELLTWNAWWPKNRDMKGFLCWGSQPVADTLKSWFENHNLQSAKYESGLDNSPMYDSVPFNLQTNLMEQADVGLMSMYIMDCRALAEISVILGKTKEATELNKRASCYTKQLATLWDEKTGIFLNKRLDTDTKSYRLSPTNFYPMLAGACSQKQAERMIKDHYYNDSEFYGEYVMPSIARNDPAFKDNDYWRGRIWGPMNFLVYLGMRNYDLTAARSDLISKSKALLMKNWKREGGVYENYNSVTGQGNDAKNADAFYHWGALLTFIEFIEKGYLQH